MLPGESLVRRCPARVQNRVPPALATNCRRPIGALTMGPLRSLVLHRHRHVHRQWVKLALEVVRPWLGEGSRPMNAGAGLEGTELVLVDALGALDQGHRVRVEVRLVPD